MARRLRHRLETQAIEHGERFDEDKFADELTDQCSGTLGACPLPT